jgi:hypothetical protein
MEPGDIVLCWSDGTARSKATITFQRRWKFPSPAPQIVHVSLYLGHGLIAHSVFTLMDRKRSAVVKEQFLDYYDGEKISLVSCLRGITDEAYIRQSIADAAQAMMGKPYGVELIASAILQGMLPNWMKAAGAANNFKKLRHSEVCSTFVVEAYLRVLGDQTPLYCETVKVAPPFDLPAAFYINPRLIDLL